MTVGLNTPLGSRSQDEQGALPQLHRLQLHRLPARCQPLVVFAVPLLQRRDGHAKTWLFMAEEDVRAAGADAHTAAVWNTILEALGNRKPTTVAIQAHLADQGV